jgi:hypothetical protein
MCDFSYQKATKSLIKGIAVAVVLLPFLSASFAIAEQFVIAEGYKTAPSGTFTISPGNIVYMNPEGTVYHAQADGPFIITMETSDNVSGLANLILPGHLAEVTSFGNAITIGSHSVRISAGTDVPGEVIKTDDHYNEFNYAFNPDDDSGVSSYHRSIPLSVGLYVSMTYSWPYDERSAYSYTSYTAHETVQTGITLGLTAFNRTSWGSDGNILIAESETITVDPPTNMLIYTPQAGVQVTPKSEQSRFFPGSTTTAFNPNVANGESATAVFTVKTPIGLHVENGVESSTIPVTVSIDSYETTKPIPASFARITNVIGDVITKDQLSGEAVPATPGMRLAPGTRLIGTAIPDNQGGIIYPRVTIQYCNGIEDVVYLTDQFGHNIVSTVGSVSTTATGKKYFRHELAVKQLSFDIVNNPRELVKKSISSAFGKLAGALSGGWGWVASNLAENATKYTIDSIDSYRQQSMQSQNMSIATESSPPAVTLEQEEQGELYDWTLYENGSFTIDNNGPSMVLATDSGSSFLMPAHTSTNFPAGSQLSSGNTVALYPFIEYENTQVITPASGSTVSRTPTITIDHIDQYSTIMKGSVACWLNGVNIAPLMQQDGASKYFNKVGLSIFAVPPEMRLLEGQNKIEVRAYDHKGVKFTGESIFTATGKPQSPVSLLSFPGTDTITLRWKANREPDVSTYRIYRGGSAEVEGTMINEVNQPVFVDDSPLAAEQWYSVSAVDGDNVESDRTKAIQVTTATSTDLLVATVSSGLAVTAQHHAISINWHVFPAGTACWRLEREEDGQDFISLMDGATQDILGVQIVTDQSTETGKQYRYRITPLNGQLTAGSSIISDWVTPLDLLPTAPGAVTVDREENYALLRWNANTNSDIIGYKLYVSENISPLTLAREELLQGTSFRYPVQGNKMYYFAMSTVDSRNREGAISPQVELSTWGSGLPTSSWSMFLPAILLNNRK